MTLTYYSNVTDGQLQNNVRQQIKKELCEFNGKRVEVRIQKLKSTRSHQQNRYWWVLMGILGNELGYTKDEIHEICKYKFLKKEMAIEKTGEVFEYLGSTATLGKMEFVELTDLLIRWASESFGIVLPVPGEQLEIE